MSERAAPFPRGEERREAATTDDAARFALAHDLRAALNAIKTWTHVLEAHLGAPDPIARRALDGILLGVEDQVRVIERMLEGRSPPGR